MGTESAYNSKGYKRKMKKLDKPLLKSIPRDALIALCANYDEEAGEYSDPKYIGKEIYQFYRSEMDKIAEEERDEELVEELAMREHKRWISQTKELMIFEHISITRKTFWENMDIPYGMLSEERKNIYREWVLKTLKIIKNMKAPTIYNLKDVEDPEYRDYSV